MRVQSGQQRRHDRMEQLARQIIAGAPQLLEQRQQLAAVVHRAARGATARAPHGPQSANRGLAMTLRDAAVLIQQPPALPLVGELVPLAQPLGVFATSAFGHGAASFPVSGLVTPVLRQPLAFR